jgi:DNA-binding transcriptional LysR family regulator
LAVAWVEADGLDRRVNVHHLELFYHVARHGGISRAVRHMPYGIQQPAVSGQIRALEKELGKPLFVRAPFKLTPEGERLFAHVEPFFGKLQAVASEIRSGGGPELRLGAAEIALRDHVPSLLARMRRRITGLRVTLREGLQTELLAWLEAGEIDLAIAVLGPRLPPGIRCRALLSVPLVLLAPATDSRRTAKAFFSSLDRPPLISLPGNESLVRQFQQDLRRLKIRWPVALQADSLVTIARYVEAGEGVALTLDLPGYVRHRGTRVIPLPGFDSVQVGLLWRQEAGDLAAVFLEEALRQVGETWPDRVVDA